MDDLELPPILGNLHIYALRYKWGYKLLASAGSWQ